VSAKRYDLSGTMTEFRYGHWVSIRDYETLGDECCRLRRLLHRLGWSDSAINRELAVNSSVTGERVYPASAAGQPPPR